MNESVHHTPELARVVALPRRRGDGTPYVEPLTALLATPEGLAAGVRLRPSQALALHDIGVYGGAFCPLGVGEGKTLITLLAPYVLDAKRPLLLLPANLIEKTERDWRRLAVHWRIPNNIRLFSYEMLGRVQSAAELDVYQPDLIVADEVHKLKNRRAAVTRRVSRWMQGHG